MNRTRFHSLRSEFSPLLELEWSEIRSSSSEIYSLHERSELFTRFVFREYDDYSIKVHIDLSEGLY